MENVVPLSTLVTSVMVPSCASTIDLAIESPSPEPPEIREREGSPR